MSHDRAEASQSSTERPERATGTRRAQSADPEVRSVWWAELALGGICALTAVVVLLANTAVGPFATLVVTYGPTPTLLYVGVAAVVALCFLASGLRSSPYLDGALAVGRPDEGAGREP